MLARLRRDLTAAMKARDTVAVAALRSTLATIANAQALRVTAGQAPAASEHVAGTTHGLGATEAPRRELTEADIRGLVAAEVEERVDAAESLDRLGQGIRAGELRAQAEYLRRYL